MKTWVRRSLNVGALTAGALLVTGAAAQAQAATSTDNDGLLNGVQALVPVNAPVTVCGNAVAVAGVAKGDCGDAAALDPAWAFSPQAAAATGGNDGALNGVQAIVPVNAPVLACGNAVAVLGLAGGDCPDAGAPKDPGYGYSTFQAENTLASSRNDGIGNGIQVLAPVNAPITVCGNGVAALLGIADPDC